MFEREIRSTKLSSKHGGRSVRSQSSDRDCYARVSSFHLAALGRSCQFYFYVLQLVLRRVLPYVLHHVLGRVPLYVWS